MTDPKSECHSIVAGKPSAPGRESLRAVDPASGEPIGNAYFIATPAQIDEAVKLASQADRTSFSGHRARADLLDAIASELGAAEPALIQIANLETALPQGRLTGEMVRTRSQLSMFAELVREGSWLDACIDHGDPNRKPAPRPDLRRMMFPLGPVAVFGASNFPFAFSVAGGDTASALAAGCPVIVKAHPAHPGTSALAGQCISRAVERIGAPASVFSLLHGGGDVGQKLVMHEALEAVAFTGSFRAGRALFDLAATRPRPIPVFAEMGSTNPVFVFNGALEERFDALVEGYVASLTLGVGQFCTNPGLVFGTGPLFERFLDSVAERLSGIEPGTMLYPGIRSAFEEGCRERSGILGVKAGSKGAKPILFRTNSSGFKEHAVLREELFGPAAVSVSCVDVAQMLAAAGDIAGQLTATILAAEVDAGAAAELSAILTGKAGRLVYNGFPTGVEVGRAMQHGGPYPATTDPRFTSVGTGAIRRFLRPVAFQDMPQTLLPEALRDGNPLAIPRQVDGAWTV